MKVIRKNKHKRGWMKHLNRRQKDEESGEEEQQEVNCLEDTFHSRLFSPDIPQKELSLAMLGNLSTSITKGELEHLLQTEVVAKIVESLSQEE